MLTYVVLLDVLLPGLITYVCLRGPVGCWLFKVVCFLFGVCFICCDCLAVNACCMFGGLGVGLCLVVLQVLRVFVVLLIVFWRCLRVLT